MSDQTKTKITSLSKYHPVRYAKARSNFIDGVAKILITHHGSDADFLFADNPQGVKNSCLFFNTLRKQHIETSISSEMYPDLLRQLLNCSYEVYEDNKSSASQIFNYFYQFTEVDYLDYLHYQSFVFNGNNVFDFNKELLEIFEETNIDDVLIKDINLVFPTIYLHFGKQSNKKINGLISRSIKMIIERYCDNQNPPDFFLDGAYISQCPHTHSLDILLTSTRNNISGSSSNCIDSYEDSLVFTLDVVSNNITVKQAVESARKNLLLHEKERIYKLDNPLFTQLDKEQTVTKNILDINNNVDLIADSLKLVINCILYLQSYPEEIEEDYLPLDISTKSKGFGNVSPCLKKQSSKLKPKFRKIKFCGRKKQYFKQFEEETVDEELLVGASVEANRFVTSHKRRAHLRKQRFGKGLEKWKFVWIKETTINREQYQPRQNFYRIYEVDDEAIG